MKDSKIKLKGFTLLEVLLYLSLLIVVISATVSFTYMMIGVKVKVKTISTANDEANHVLNFITQHVRNAHAVNISTNNLGGVLSLDISDTPNSPIVFRLLDNSIIVSEGKNKSVPLTSKFIKISELNFVNISLGDSKTLLKTSFNLNVNNINQRQEFNYGKIYEAYVSTRN